MNSKPNRIGKVAAVTITLFGLIAISALMLHLNRNLIVVEAFGATYSIQLTAFLISAIIFISGILLYDYIYLNLLKNSKSKKILLTLYYLMIYILRIFVAAFLVFGVFDFYLINSDYELSVNLKKIGFYIFPMISPIAIGIALLVHYKLDSNHIS